MKKILFVTLNRGADDRTVWSGTPYSVNKELKKYYQVEPCVICAKYPISSYLKKCIFKIINKSYLQEFDKSYAIITSRILEERIEKIEYDAMVVIGSMEIAFINCEKPIIYISDAVFSTMINYYWYNLSEYSIKNGNDIQKKALENATRVVLSSEWAKKDAKKMYEIDEKKIDIIHFGANLDNDNFKSIKHEGINLLFVGVDWERKGADIAIQCVDRLNEIDNKQKYHLHLVGCNPPYEVNSKNVTLYGFLNNNNTKERELLKHIRTICDLFILPTRAECAGIVFCEACAYGLPSITFDTGGIPDYVINDVNGYRLPITASSEDFADKIYGLILNADKLKRMKANARSIYNSDLNWEVFGKKLYKIIEEITD